MRKFVIKKITGITLLLILSSCIQTEILNAPIEQVDTIATKGHRPPRDTIEVDTTRVAISFNPSVEEWEEKDIEL